MDTNIFGAEFLKLTILHGKLNDLNKTFEGITELLKVGSGISIREKYEFTKAVSELRAEAYALNANELPGGHGDITLLVGNIKELSSAAYHTFNSPNNLYDQEAGTDVLSFLALTEEAIQRVEDRAEDDYYADHSTQSDENDLESILEILNDMDASDTGIWSSSVEQAIEDVQDSLELLGSDHIDIA